MAINPYNVLGIAPHAEDVAVTGAYKALIRKYHPDIAGDDEHAGARIREITEAYAILRDPTQRAAYDRAAAPSTPPPAPPPHPSGQPRSSEAHSTASAQPSPRHRSLVGRVLVHVIRRLLAKAIKLARTGFAVLFSALALVSLLGRYAMLVMAALNLVGGLVFKVDTRHNVMVFAAATLVAWLVSACIMTVGAFIDDVLDSLARRFG